MLSQHRRRVVDRVAKNNQNDGVRKQFRENGDARDIGVVLRQIANVAGIGRAPQSDHLGNMRFEESIEFSIGMFVGIRPCLDAIGKIFLRPEGAPYHLLERLGAVEADFNAVAMRSLGLGALYLETTRKRVPQHWRQQKRHMPVRVNRKGSSCRQRLEQNGRSGPWQRSNENRSRDVHLAKTPGVKAVLDVRRGLLQSKIGERRAMQESIQPRVSLFQRPSPVLRSCEIPTRPRTPRDVFGESHPTPSLITTVAARITADSPVRAPVQQRTNRCACSESGPQHRHGGHAAACRDAKGRKSQRGDPLEDVRDVAFVAFVIFGDWKRHPWLTALHRATEWNGDATIPAKLRPDRDGFMSSFVK